MEASKPKWVNLILKPLVLTHLGSDTSIYWGLQASTYFLRSHILTALADAEYRIFVALDMAISFMWVSPGGICKVRDWVAYVNEPFVVSPDELKVFMHFEPLSLISQTWNKLIQN